jgi:hypothetical protein
MTTPYLTQDLELGTDSVIVNGSLPSSDRDRARVTHLRGYAARPLVHFDALRLQ